MNETPSRSQVAQMAASSAGGVSTPVGFDGLLPSTPSSGAAACAASIIAAVTMWPEAADVATGTASIPSARMMLR